MANTIKRKKLYSLNDIKSAMKRTFVQNEKKVMGVEIIEKPEDGEWFEALFKTFKKNL